MSAAEPAAVRPDASEIKAADVAMRRVKRYLSTHADEHDIRVVVGGDPDDTLSLPRGCCRAPGADPRTHGSRPRSVRGPCPC